MGCERRKEQQDCSKRDCALVHGFWWFWSYRRHSLPLTKVCGQGRAEAGIGACPACLCLRTTLDKTLQLEFRSDFLYIRMDLYLRMLRNLGMSSFCLTRDESTLRMRVRCALSPEECTGTISDACCHTVA